MTRERTICAIVPAHNEARTVAEVISGVRRFIPSVLAVDDGSSDATGQLAQRAGAHVLRHPVQSGKGCALRTGFAWARAAGYDDVITLDADGQHDPGDIPRLVAAAEAADMVLGYRAFDH